MDRTKDQSGDLLTETHGTLVAKRDGTILFVSDGVRVLLALGDRDIIGQSVDALFRIGEHANLLPLRPWAGPAACISCDGRTQPVHLRIEDSNDCVGDSYLLSIALLQSRPLQVADLDDARQHRLRSLGTLAGVVAHDVNNILTGVLGHVSFLKMVLTHEAGHADSLTAIEDGARRAAMMTQQILDFTRGNGGETEKVDLAYVIRQSIMLLKGSLPDDIRCVVNIPEAEYFVRGKESQLSQMVMNLAVNARDALTEGGSITITLDVHSPGSGEAVMPGASGPAEYARLSISDDGVGIPPDVRDRMFEPFFTTKTSRGTGLGLATVFSVVRSHHGYLEVDSEPGKGTTFFIYLPLAAGVTEAPADQPPREEAEEELDVVPRGTERILVVDDEEAVRTVVQRSLEHLGYIVDVAENGAEAIERYKQAHAPYDLVILDMMMPKMPGDEVFYHLRNLNEAVPVLIASGYASDGRAKAIIDAGGLGFIQKPFAVEELAREVRTCLDRRSSQHQND